MNKIVSKFKVVCGKEFHVVDTGTELCVSPYPTESHGNATVLVASQYSRVAAKMSTKKFGKLLAKKLRRYAVTERDALFHWVAEDMIAAICGIGSIEPSEIQVA